MTDEYLACVGHIVKTQDLHGNGRTCLLYPVALIIQHGADLTVGSACCNEVSDLEGTLLYQDCGHGASSFVKLCLDDQTSRLSLGIGLKLQYVGSQGNHLQQFLYALSGLG